MSSVYTILKCHDPGIQYERLLLTAYLLTPAVAPTRSDKRHRHRQTLAAADTRDGGGADRSRVDLERGTAVPRAAVAAASGGVSKPVVVGSSQRRGPEQATCVH